MKKKLRVGIIFGGPSAEHEVSIQSAKNVYDALDKEKYEPYLFGITKKGEWISLDSQTFLHISSRVYHALPEETEKDNERFVTFPLSPSDFDVVFPVLHGPFGEDGTIQGFLKTLNIPFVGAGVLGSAVGMDKDVMKRLLRDAKLKIGKFITLRKKDTISFEDVKKELGLPLFVKPANLGSSVGVSKVTSEEEYSKAIKEAFRYDTKVLVEEYIKGRELECSVLGNEEPVASIAGEVIPQKGFYDYQSKYLDEGGAILKIPANLSEEELKKIQQISLETYRVLNCEGLARVDVFMTEDGEIYINEINTLPGFTKISMYPKLWKESGLEYGELLDRLITLALERHKRESALRSDLID